MNERKNTREMYFSHYRTDTEHSSIGKVVIIHVGTIRHTISTGNLTENNPDRGDTRGVMAHGVQRTQTINGE